MDDHDFHDYCYWDSSYPGRSNTQPVYGQYVNNYYGHPCYSMGEPHPESPTAHSTDTCGEEEVRLSM